jgi:L-ribulokinase
MRTKNLVIGADFGTDSVRTVLVDAVRGLNLSECQCLYPRWSNKEYCNPEQNIFRQHPKDHLESLTFCIKKMIKEGGPSCKTSIAGIAVDTTGSTVAPVDKNGRLLTDDEQYEHDPDALFYLWKDHSAIEEAKEIDKVFKNYSLYDYTKYQGTYQSEWYWAKILHAVRYNKNIRKDAFSWVEHCDWIPATLTGRIKPSEMYRSSCAAGHKALWHSRFGGLPTEECLKILDPYLVQVANNYAAPAPASTLVGKISAYWAEQFDLETDCVIGGSSFDAHAGAVGTGIKLNTLIKIIGTSAVDLLIQEKEYLFQNPVNADVCGQAEDSIIPGFIGMEAGQAAFGDIFNWIKETVFWPFNNLSAILPKDLACKSKEIMECFEKAFLPSIESGLMGYDADTKLIALDYFNGRRYPELNESLSGAVYGLKIGTGLPDLYHAFALSAVFGAKNIFDKYIESGLVIDKIIASGGIAEKSLYVMQMMADCFNRPIYVSECKRACALGAAIYASVASGLYRTIPEAQEVMSSKIKNEYIPDTKKAITYQKMFKKYLYLVSTAEAVNDAIIQNQGGVDETMKLNK